MTNQSSPSGTGPKPEFIQDLFGSIAKNYDKANSVITMGLDQMWRRALVDWSGVQAGSKVLDCATGTGDLAFAFKRRVGASGHVIGTDFCKEMLEETSEKKQKLSLDVQFEWADVTKLPYPDEIFDATSIAYGIRNVNEPIQGLKEMYRVTKKGGSLMVLETGSMQVRLIQKAFDFYFKNLVPRLGGWVTGKPSAYKYLNQSSSKFPCRKDFVEMINQAGDFNSVEYKTLMGGASFIYKAVKL